MALLILQVLFMGQAKCKLYKCKNHTSLEYISTTNMQLLWMWISFLLLPSFPKKTFLMFTYSKAGRGEVVLEGKGAEHVIELP